MPLKLWKDLSKGYCVLFAKLFQPISLTSLSDSLLSSSFSLYNCPPHPYLVI